MPNVTIPSLPPAISLNGTELLEIVQNGTSMKCTVAQIVFLALSYSNSANTVCSNRQMRSALAAIGQEVTIDNVIPADINDARTIQWRNGNIVVLNDALSNLIQTTLGYTAVQMAALFASALTFPL